MNLPPVQGQPLPVPALTRAGVDGETPAADGKSGSFADLLAQMIGEQRDPDSFLGAPPPLQGERPSERPQLAEIFNENGLVQGVAPLGAAVGAADIVGVEPKAKAEIPAPGTLRRISGRLGPTSPVPPLGGEDALQSASEGFAAPATSAGSRNDRQRAPRSRATGPAAAAPAGRAGGRIAPLAPSNAAAAARAALESRESRATGKSHRRAALLMQDYLRQAGAINAQVSVQAAEQGISLVARVEKLTREQKMRLRAEIAGLLARHGYSAAEIRLNGETGPATPAVREGS
jgi:hypothetical protein